MKQKKECPSCSSKRITYNEKGELHCKKCGYSHSMNKNAQMVEFEYEKN